LTRRAATAPDLRSVRESELEGNVIELAQLLGWKVAHFRPAVLPSGRWATHMRGDKGYPDLTMAKKGRLIFAELKRTGEDPTSHQDSWLEVLGSVPGVKAVVWRTEDWVSGAIEAELRAAAARAPRGRRKGRCAGEGTFCGIPVGSSVAAVEARRGELVRRRVLG